jgi:NAD(P)-dependent dehydrogenase (short-subunit alcohol dehydrogenase family)
MNGGSGFVASPGAALVTGAASGIGRKIAEHLSLARYSVVLHCSLASRANAEAAAAGIKAQGGKAGVLASDLREPGPLARLTADIGEGARRAQLTLLVNNAAIFEADDAASLRSRTLGQAFFGEFKGAAHPFARFRQAAAARNRRRDRQHYRSKGVSSDAPVLHL